MTDLEVLFLVLIGLYLSYAGHWYRGDAELFRAAGRHAWTRTEAFGGFRGGRLKVVFADLLPPLHGVAICAALPFRVSPAGICTASGEFVGFAAFRADERKLYSGEVLLGEFRTEDEAQQWCRRLEQLASVPAKTVEARLRRELCALFDARAARDRLDAFQQHTRWLRRFANTMFFWLFVVGPVSIQLLGLGITWLPLLVGVVLLLALTVRAFVRAHRALYPQERGARFRQTLTMALSPPAAARAADPLLLDLFAAIHPLAVAAEVFASDEFTKYAGQVLRALRYPLAEDLTAEAAEVARWYSRELLAAAEEFATARGFDRARAYAVPEPQSPAVVAYCPRCRMQYLHHAAACADCPGMALVAFTAPATAAAN
jgi:hypothetical protein